MSMDDPITSQPQPAADKAPPLPRRFYTFPQMLIGMLFTGFPVNFFASLFFMYENYKAMGQRSKATAVMLWATALTYPVLFLSIWIPRNFSDWLLLFISMAFLMMILLPTQYKAIQKISAAGQVQRFTYWRMAGVCVGATAVCLVIIMSTYFIVERVSIDLFEVIFPDYYRAELKSRLARLR